MTETVLSCCVCLKKNSSTPITKCDSTNVSIISKLQLIASEVEWEPNYTICEECEVKLNVVIEFRNLCLESEQFRKNLDTKSSYDSHNYECDDWGDIKADISDGEDNLIECKVCNINFESDNALNQHNVETHRLFSCFSCDNVFSLKSELEKHEKSHHDLVCMQCNEKFSTQALLEKHIETHIGVFVCYHCSKGFKSKSLLIRHITLVHVKNASKRTKTCQHCDNVYINKTLLEDHMRKVHGIGNTELIRRNKSYQCTKCEKSYTLEKVMKNHMMTCDGVKRHSKINLVKDPNQNKCDKCERFYTTEKILKAHRKTCRGIKEKERTASAEKAFNFKHNLDCNLCKLEFNSEMERQNHFLLEHKLDTSADNLCNFCYQQFDNSEDCRDHVMLSHSSEMEDFIKKEKRKSAERSYSCEVCGKIFGYVKEVLEHCSTEHNMDPKSVKPFLCDKCEMRFTSSANMIQHKQYHEGNRTHICSFCGKSYITKSDLTVHEYTHYNKRNYKCEFCQKAFNTNKNLRSHKLVVHTDSSLWKYACPLCEKRFPLKSGYDQHVRRHAGDKRFICHICQKPFISGSELRKHMSFHSNVRAFKCSHCGKEYKEKRVFEIHMTKVHGIGNAKIPVRVKKYVCHICSNRFLDRQKLARHMCTHSGLKPYPCTLCEKKFTDKSYLKQHMKVAHNIYEIPEYK